MFDYHVHTDFSADSNMPMAEACAAAVKKGIREIAFTEHLDVIYPDSELQWDFDYDDYTREIATLQAEYRGRLVLVRGVEVGLHPSGYEASCKFTEQGRFDFVLGSVHVVDDGDLHDGAFFQGKTCKEALTDYFIALNEQVKNYRHFNVVGHLDLIKRYVRYLNCQSRDINWKDYYDIIEDTLKELIHTGRGIEVNMSGYRYGLDCSLPDFDVICLYRQLGGEIITVGSDAHNTANIGLKLDEAMDLLRRAGFKYVTTFREQKPVFRSIER